MAFDRRDHVLGLLGIERWRLRESGDPSASEAPVEQASMPRKKNIETTSVPAPEASVATVELPKNWSGLRAMVKDCQQCKLCQARTNTVFGVGPENAPLMVVGEGPGADEDARGEPFVGRAGKLLDQMLKAISRSRADNTFIANVVKCRPPGNRDPEADEVSACRRYLDRQIELLQPRLIVALGRVAAQRLLASNEPLSKMRGPIHEYGETRTPVFVSYHPAYLLRSPREKAKSWQDLKKIAQFLESQA